MKKVDLIFIQREVFPFFTPLFERIIRSKTSKLVFDFDDAIFLKPEGWKNWRDYLRKPNRVSEIISLADTVIAGNKYLKEYSLKFNNSCLVLPTVHKRDKSEKPSHIDNKIVVLGWIGNWTTLRNLFLIQSELEDLSKDIPFEIKLFGASNIYQFKLNSASVKYEMWSLEREEAFLSEIDIGIMPLYNTPWEKGKCGFKLIQYMTFSKPVIGSKVGVNEEIIDHGKNGYLCESSKDWKYAIEELVQDNNKRKQFGEQSYKIVQDRYSYAKNLKVIRSIIDGSI